MVPSNVTFRTAVSGKLFLAAVLIDGVIRNDVIGLGASKDEAIASATGLYMDRIFDKRSLALHAKDTKWIHRTGETARRIPASELEAYVAQGFTAGKGKTGPRVKAEPIVEPATVQ